MLNYSLINIDLDYLFYFYRTSEIELWIGLTRTIKADNVWQWSDDSKSSWSFWATNEPSGSGKCTRMSFKGRWRDTYCANNVITYKSVGTHNISFICKKGNYNIV